MRKHTLEEIISKFKLIHGDKYTYEFVNHYVNSNTKIKINCPVDGHGIFEQFTKSHLKGTGCPKCTWTHAYCSTEEIIEKFKKVHGNFYNYSLVDFKNGNTPVKIISPIKEHGIFEQKIYSHLQGYGCKKCGLIKRSLNHFSKTHSNSTKN